jgi:hypothetical protein
MFVLRAFQRGADGVIICGCHPGDCHYTSGNYYARRRMTMMFSMLDYLGIEKGRTRVEWVSAAEGAKFAATMNEFVEKAIRFYAGYVSNEKVENYLPNIVISALKSIVRDSENRHNRNLYRIALEMSMLMNVMAATHHIPEESLVKLRGDCEDEIKRINGTLSLDTAVKWQS